MNPMVVEDDERSLAKKSLRPPTRSRPSPTEVEEIPYYVLSSSDLHDGGQGDRSLDRKLRSRRWLVLARGEQRGNDQSATIQFQESEAGDRVVDNCPDLIGRIGCAHHI
jgi:hypothetical protein